MSKYDFGLDLDSENSLSLIIDMIKPNSKILEFGPAHGRLTKYLNENMNCIVDIVELDEEAGLEASQYANKYFIGDKLGNIENYLWLEELKEAKYDYIVFADVLEHLYWPDKVLKKCKMLLKDEGSILLSLPNIAHNSVIIDLINDEFKYNEIGLLDNTHIRFFTYNSLIRMLSESGLVTSNEKATYNRVGENEIRSSYTDIDRTLSKKLKMREHGNVYQFIFEVKKKEFSLGTNQIRSINFDKAIEYEFVLYIKDKYTEEYTEKKTIRKSIVDKKVSQQISLKEYEGIKEVRIDPITSNCILEGLEIYTKINDERIDLPIKYTNSDIKYNGIYFFNTEDPQIYIDLLDKNINEIYVNYILVEYDSEYINENMIYLFELDKKESYIRDVESELNQKESYIIDIESKLEAKKQYIRTIENSRGYKLLSKIKKILGK